MGLLISRDSQGLNAWKIATAQSIVNPWLGEDLSCSPFDLYIMRWSDRVKESCDGSLLMTLCSCIVALQQLLPIALNF